MSRQCRLQLASKYVTFNLAWISLSYLLVQSIPLPSSDSEGVWSFALYRVVHLIHIPNSYLPRFVPICPPCWLWNHDSKCPPSGMSFHYTIWFIHLCQWKLFPSPRSHVLYLQSWWSICRWRRFWWCIYSDLKNPFHVYSDCNVLSILPISVGISLGY